MDHLLGTGIDVLTIFHAAKDLWRRSEEKEGKDKEAQATFLAVLQIVTRGYRLPQGNQQPIRSRHAG
ncbi:MAG TPA: hypothetical protein VGJ48_25575 [Pyrinomonadaceae bacterium]